MSQSPSIQKQIHEQSVSVFYSCYNLTSGRITITDHTNDQFNGRSGQLCGFTGQSNKMIVVLDSVQGESMEPVEVPLNTVNDVGFRVRHHISTKEVHFVIADIDKIPRTFTFAFEKGLHKVITSIYPSPQERHQVAFPYFKGILESQLSERKKILALLQVEEEELQARLAGLRIRHDAAIKKHKDRIYRASRIGQEGDCCSEKGDCQTSLEHTSSTRPCDSEPGDILFKIPFSTFDDSLHNCSESLFKIGDNVMNTQSRERIEDDIVREFGIDDLVINQTNVESLYNGRADDTVIDLCMKW